MFGDSVKIDFVSDTSGATVQIFNASDLPIYEKLPLSLEDETVFPENVDYVYGFTVKIFNGRGEVIQEQKFPDVLYPGSQFVFSLNTRTPPIKPPCK
jgi:hypothetical protein